MKEPRTIEGRWWLFGRECESYFGVLRYDPEKGVELEVKIPRSVQGEDVVAEMADDPVNKVSDVIEGRDEHDKPIILIGCLPRSTSKSTGLCTYKMGAMRALIGMNYASWKEARFTSASCHFSLLHNWLGRTQITQGRDSENRPCISFVPDSEIGSISISPKATLKIESSLETGGDNAEYRITQGHHLTFRIEQPIQAAELISKYVLPFRNLLTLLAGKSAFLDRIEFLQPVKAELLMLNSGISSARRDVPDRAMLVPYHEIASSAPAIIAKWYNYAEELEPVLNLYFLTVYNTDLYGPHKFLFLAQALEVYHATCNSNFSGTAEPKVDFQRRVQEILNGAAPQHRDWLSEKLNFANQKTLAQRLSEILDKHQSDVSAFIPDPSDFAKKVKDTRNYYTHFDAGLMERGKVMHGGELARMLGQMRTLLQICFLKDLGISGAPIQRIIGREAAVRIVSL